MSKPMKFSCPNCGEPWAQVEEREADIHCGTIHHCDACKGEVIFEAFSRAEWARRCEAMEAYSAAMAAEHGDP